MTLMAEDLEVGDVFLYTNSRLSLWRKRGKQDFVPWEQDVHWEQRGHWVDCDWGLYPGLGDVPVERLTPQNIPAGVCWQIIGAKVDGPLSPRIYRFREMGGGNEWRHVWWPPGFGSDDGFWSCDHRRRTFLGDTLIIPVADPLIPKGVVR